jgi:hypothetical protein
MTIASCELVLSPPNPDVEELHDAIRAYHRCLANSFDPWGTVRSETGNTVVVYFGYPAAHEDDAEQAVRAALGLFTAIQRLPAPPGLTLRVRIGIATGLSIVDDRPLVGETRDGSIVGEAPVVAGRLQGLAEPGTVIVDKTTRALVGELFNCRDLGASAQAWQVSGVRDVDSRFKALRGTSADRAGSAAGHGRLAGRGEGRVQTALSRRAIEEKLADYLLTSARTGVSDAAQRGARRVLCLNEPFHERRGSLPGALLPRLCFASTRRPFQRPNVRKIRIPGLPSLVTGTTTRTGPYTADAGFLYPRR